MAPWTRQRVLQEEYGRDQVPDIDELAAMLDRVRFGKLNPTFQTQQARALFVLYYLTACRISEIVKVTRLHRSRIIKEGDKELSACSLKSYLVTK